MGAVSPAFAQSATEEIVVTAQKREQAIQDVPIAVSAFSEDVLADQGLDGGYDLVQAVPNVSFSKGNFTGYNFQIRAVGAESVAASGDAGVGVHLNNAPLTANRLFEADFYDVARVEVLRGPQGTLFGRNSTGGVVNVITQQPVGEFEASVRGEYASYNTRRLTGMINIPILGDDVMALRVAGTALERDGFVTNEALGTNVDGRDIWAARATLSFNPTDNISSWLMYEHFEEDDDRSRVGKQLCITDPGPTSVNGNAITNPVARGFFAQGCLPGRLTDDASLGTVNSLSTLGGSIAALIGAASGNVNQGLVQNPDLRVIQSVFEPIYQAEEDVALLNITVDLSDALTLTSLTSWSRDEYYTFQDYNRLVPVVPFNFVPGLTTPAGVFCDPQLGCFDRLATADISSSSSEQFTQELRLQSDFDGPLNFSIGAIMIDFTAEPVDYWVLSNSLTMAAYGFGLGAGVDTSNPPTGNGRNYYLNRTRSYELNSLAYMGEVYWEAFDGFTVTGGVRFTQDEKTIVAVSPILLTAAPAVVTNQNATFEETTGRLGFDWQVNTGFTDQTLVYAFYSRGYKGGGFNPPSSVGIAGITDTFDPEFVNAYEVGVKNTLFDGSMIFNATAFMYDYEGYQISKIVNRSSVNENIDAEVRGAEFELAWEPFTGFRINGTLGLLDTEITGGDSIDVFNRLQGATGYTLIHDPNTAQNCLAPTAFFIAPRVAAINTNPGALVNACAPAGNPLGLTAWNGVGTPGPTNTVQSGGPIVGGGVPLEGNELPNAPNWTFSFGAEYSWPLGGGWEATARADYFQQDDSFLRIFNSDADTLEGYSNLNVLFRVANPENGVSLEAFAQNVTDEVAITDAYLTDDSSGLFRNIFLTEPRIVGLRAAVEF